MWAATKKYDDLASRVVAAYELFLFALNGRYQQMRAPGVEVTPRALRDLQVDAYTLGKTFLNIAETEVENYLRPLLEDRSDALQTALTLRKKEALALVRGMVIENVKQTGRAGRTGIGGFSDLLRDARGGVGLLVQRAVGTVGFKVTDTSGRKWEPAKLMQVVVRDFGYQADIDAFVDLRRAFGDTLAAAIWINEGGYIVDQVIFAIGENDIYPTFEAIRDTVFHPNSKAIVTPYVPAQ